MRDGAICIMLQVASANGRASILKGRNGLNTKAGDRGRSVVQDDLVEFSQSVVPGVEIKRCRRSPYDYKAHVHHELTLAYIQEGSTDLSLSDRTIHFEAGDGAVIPPMFTHRCAPNDIDHWAYIALFVDPAYYGDMVAFSSVRKLEVARAHMLWELMEQLRTEKDADALANVLIGLLVEYGDETKPGAAAAVPSAMVRVRDYLAETLYAPVSLDRLEDTFGINKFSLIKGFRKLYATTPAAFHLQCRVARAKTMLVDGRDVFEICGALHFYDQAHLIREFRKMYGITPAAYLEQLRKS